jgi:hypothetical protein
VDQELQEKIQRLDESIKMQESLYQQLAGFEKLPKIYWSDAGRNREREILNEIVNLEEAKIRLINNEKIPEKIYVDREVVRYKDRIIKRVIVHKSSLANAFMWFSFLSYAVLYILYSFNYLRIFFVFK